MRSVTAGLARQVLVAVAMSALLIAGLSVRPGGVGRAPANASAEKPIPTRAIVTAEAPPAAPIKRPPAMKLASATKPGGRLPAPAPPPRPADPATKVVATAYVAPAPQPETPSLKKRLFAPVGFVRDNVARLISWL